MSKGILKEIRIGGGLLPTPPDERDFQLGALYKFPALSEIPDEFTVSPLLRIKDQGQSDMCAAFASTYASEVQEGIELSPEWQFAKIKELSGDPTEWGADLRTALKSLVKFGSVSIEDVPAELRYSDEKNNRDLIADIRNWPALEDKAVKYKKSSFFKIEGPYDLFDNIRATLWMSKKEFDNDAGKISLLKLAITGAIWKHAWTVAEGGIIPTEPATGGFGHAFVFVGTIKINGEIYIETRLSNGEGIGVGGSFFFSREVVNRELQWGAYTLKDISPEVAKYLIDNNWSLASSWLARIILAIKNYFRFFAEN